MKSKFSWTNIFGVGAIVILILLICACLIALCLTKSFEGSLIEHKIHVYTPVVINTQDTVDVSYKELALKVDSLKAQNAALKYHYENCVNDLRQETNNIINKMNGWLGFWIAMSTILSIIVPLICQYVITTKTDEENEKKYNRIKEDAEKAINKVNEAADGADIKVDEAINKIKEQLGTTHIQATLAKIRTGSELKMIELNRFGLFSNALWCETVDHFISYAHKYTEGKNFGFDNRICLLELLVQLRGMLNLYLRKVGVKRSRSHNLADKKIKDLFESVENNTYGDMDNLRKQIYDIIALIRPLP